MPSEARGSFVPDRQLRMQSLAMANAFFDCNMAIARSGELQDTCTLKTGAVYAVQVQTHQLHGSTAHTTYLAVALPSWHQLIRIRTVHEQITLSAAVASFWQQIYMQTHHSTSQVILF